MQRGQPSRTAFAAAAHRAAHQTLEQGRIFADPLAARILGEDPDAIARDASENPERTGMRLFIAARSRFAQDSLASAIHCGTEQLVVLGAGLDTFAYRSPFRDRLKIFEVDHPDTQAWKRARLLSAGIEIPPWLTFAPVDFERETLAGGLAAARFDPARATFFNWLGVVPYLTKDAIASTLACIAAISGGAHVVFDFADPPESLSPELRLRHQRRAERVAAIGEAFLSYFDSMELRALLTDRGFREIDDLGPRQIAERYFAGLYFKVPLDSIPERGGHILRASTTSLL
ncbi:MAG TPA: SAM-dependent methyltransferase [Bryobacteraceae bacterium]|nr:SAM-dependent methyltransferase [Bryobacteraceae bacterium]